jgi:RND family efflux transporter MFP subunit
MKVKEMRAASVVFAVLLAGLCATGCFERQPPVRQPEPPTVAVARPVERELIAYREYTGRVAAVEDVEIRARVTGYVTDVNFTEGDKVEAGKVLFKIDPRPFEATLELAKADVKKWEADVIKTKADLGRIEKLRKTGAATQEQLDTAVAAQKAAEAGLEGAKANVEQAQLDVDFTDVMAPVAGRVGRALVTKGNLVSGNQSLGTPLTTLVSTDPMQVYFNMDEATVLEVKARYREQGKLPGDVPIRELNIPVYIGLANEEGFPHKGVVDFADNRVDEETGTLQVRGEFANPMGLLNVGMFCRVRVPVGDPAKKLLVQDRAVGTSLDAKYIWIVDEKNVASQRVVTLGDLDGRLRVIESNLKAGEWVIVNGMQRVRDGDTVAPKKEPMVGEEVEAGKPAENSDAP